MRLIDADRLKAEVTGWCVVTDDLFGMGKYHEREIVLQAIEESPTINAVPVVRDELKRYKQAEQEGRLYNLPLKPGDTIYRPEALQFCWVITKVEIYEDEIVFIDDSDNIFRPDDIGKTIFLTREEAEKALKERDNT